MTRPDTATDMVFQTIASAIDSADTKKWLDFFSDDIFYTDEPTRTICRGRAEVAALFEAWFTAYTDHDFKFGASFGAADSIARSWTMSATVRGNFRGISRDAAAGRRFTLNGVTLYRFNAAGKICWQHAYWDLASLLRQIGVAEVPQ